ncbi:MAG TPA: serine hydrolase, partial [Polyangiales bacterium]|nr:serine hydrolase [Polyangiales bacterium]
PYADGTPPVRMGDPHVVPFFDLAGIRFSPSRVFDAKSFPSAGGGMNGTADEVARVLELVRSGGGALLKKETTESMLANQTGALPVVLGPGWGFGFGGAVLVDPRTAQTPQSAGTWTWGGVWGHNWFVDPAKRLVVVGLTNTAIEGMMGRLPVAMRDTVYAA